MPFTNRPTGQTEPTGPGESYSDYGIVYTVNDYASGLLVGRFCKIITSSIDPIGRAENINGSENPTLGGVVKRNPANIIESGNTIAVFSQTDIQKAGLITVEAIAGQLPAFRAAVYAHNKDDVNAGKASITATDNVDAKAEFIRKITDTTWLIELK